MQEEEKRSEETLGEKPTEEKVLERLEEEEKRLKELEERLTKLENIARVANQRLVELQREYELLKERYRRDIEEFRKYGHDRFAWMFWRSWTTWRGLLRAKRRAPRR
jgi:molecular chaperone GrpE